MAVGELFLIVIIILTFPLAIFNTHAISACLSVFEYITWLNLTVIPKNYGQCHDEGQSDDFMGVVAR